VVIKVHHGFIDHEDGYNPGKWPPRIQLNATVNNDMKILTDKLNVNKTVIIGRVIVRNPSGGFLINFQNLSIKDAPKPSHSQCSFTTEKVFRKLNFGMKRLMLLISK
jgi:hypothetical protein